jgi:methionyl-tRNA synthetase
MRLSATANAYVAEQAPWALVKTDPDRAATVLYTALRAVDDLKTLLAPFLPFSSQRVHELLGGEGWLAGPLEICSVEEDDGTTHEVLTGDYEGWVGAWSPGDLPAGRPLPEPQPLFRKLDAEAVLAAELA